MDESMAAQVKEENDFLRTRTVPEMLQYLNSDAMASKGVACYYALVPYGDPHEYAVPDLLAAWYQRNIRNRSRHRQLIDAPNDRIRVIYGAGHLGWLRQDAANDATVKLRKRAELTAGRWPPSS
jgi:hypothetical protein